MGEVDKKPSHHGGGQNKKRWGNNKKKQHVAKPIARTSKFIGGKDELGGHHFDCTGYGQSDRFVKTVRKIADYIAQEYKCGSVTRKEVMTQGVMIIPQPTRPVGRTVTDENGAVTRTPPDAMDISDYQGAKKIYNYEILHQKENQQKLFSLVWQQCTESMHAKIKAHREYIKIEADVDGINLLRVFI